MSEKEPKGEPQVDRTTKEPNPKSTGKVNGLNKLKLGARSRLPVMHQAEAAECGLTCLAMISEYYGHKTSLTELRRRFSVSLKGVDLRALATMSDQMQMSTRALRCELDELTKLRTPCVLHWDLNHFVVLKKATNKKIVIHDPARGKRTLPLAEVSKHFTGVAMELTPTPDFKKKSVKERVRIFDLWNKMTGFVPILLQIIAITLILQVFTIISPLVNQLVVDEAIAKNDENFLKVIVLGFALILIIRTSIETLRSWISMYFGTLLNYQMRSNMLRHVMRLEAEFFEKRHIGDIMSRMGSLKPVQDLFTQSFVTVLLDGLMAIITCVVMFLYSPMLTLVVIGVVFLSFLVRLITFPIVLRMEEERIQKEAELDTISLETIRGARAIKIFGREQERHAHWQNSYADSINVGLRLERFNIISGSGNRMVFGLLELGIYFLGAMLVINAELTLGMFFAFQSYRGQFSERVNSLVDMFFSFRTVGLHLERLADIVYAEPESGIDAPLMVGKTLSGSIESSNIDFRYGDAEPWILRGIDFKINAGDKVALVGPSGGGKTTLLKLLIGLHRPVSGEVLYDGRSVEALGVRAVRSQLGVVMQDDRLLSGSLYDNISFFDPTINHERVESCAMAAQVHADIMGMPMGFQSLVGDMGSSLSGGQIQRILLARALYASPQMLFLDEGTANLDSESEAAIVELLEQIPITQVIVAHRTAAISHCNRFLEVRDGEVKEISRDLVFPNGSPKSKRTSSPDLPSEKA